MNLKKSTNVVHYLRYTIKVKKTNRFYLLDCLVDWLVGWLVALLISTSAIRLYCERAPTLTSDNFTCFHTETERGEHDFCLSRSHYSDTDPISRERIARAGIEPTISSSGVACSTSPPVLPAKKHVCIKVFIFVDHIRATSAGGTILMSPLVISS